MSVILNDLIDATRKSVHHHSRLRLYIALILILSSVLVTGFLIFTVQTYTFYADEGVQIQRRAVPTYDAKNIPCYILMSDDTAKKKDQSTPVVILIHGVNGKKEDLLKKALNLAQNGFIAVPIDQRGHGDSNTYSSIGYQEVDDVSALIDWMAHEMPQANTTCVGITGESLGGITAYIAQTRDHRIKATVAFNAVSNITQALDILGIQSFFSTGQEMADTPDNRRIRSPIFHITPENTHNLLILHGDADVVVNISQSYDVYNKLDGDSRDDITMIVSHGETHGGNQLNVTNLQMTILWMRHFLKGEEMGTDKDSLKNLAPTVDVNNLYRPPVDLLLAVLGWISIVIFLLLARVFMQTEVEMQPRSKRTYLMLAKEIEERDDYGKRRVKIVLGYILGSYFAIYLASGIISSVLRFSIIEAYYIIPAVVGIPILMIVVYRTNAFRENLWRFLNKHMGMGRKDLPLSLVVLVIPFLTFIFVADGISWALYTPGYNIFNGSFLFFTFVFFLAFFFDIFVLRLLQHVKGSKLALFARKHDYLTLAILKFSTALIFLFYPSAHFYSFPISLNWILVFAAFGIPLFFLIYIHIYEKISKNLISAVLLNALVIATIIVRVLFRFV